MATTLEGASSNIGGCWIVIRAKVSSNNGGGGREVSRGGARQMTMVEDIERWQTRIKNKKQKQFYIFLLFSKNRKQKQILCIIIKHLLKFF